MTKLKASRKRYRKTIDRFQNTIFILEGKKDEAPLVEMWLDLKPKKTFSKHLLKKMEGLFVKRVAASGGFKGFTQKAYYRALKKGIVPKGYVVSYFVPPSIGGSYTESNMIITRPEIVRLMDLYYWKQMAPFVNKARHQPNGHKLGIAFRKVPKVLTPEAFLNFVLPNERDEFVTRLNHILHWREKVQEKACMEEGSNFVYFRLKRNLQPPNGMKKAILRVEPASMVERSAVKAEYHTKRPEMVLACLERGDFDGLSPEMRERIVRDNGYVPTETKLTCHHIVPRSLGGANTLDNILWLSVEDHMNLHEKYLNPLYFCIEQMQNIQKPIYVQMPIPEHSNLLTYVKVGDRMVPSVPSKETGKKLGLGKRILFDKTH